MFTVQQRVGADFMGIRLNNRAEISYSVYTLNGDLMYDDIDSYPDNINQNTHGEQFGDGKPASDEEGDEDADSIDQAVHPVLNQPTDHRDGSPAQEKQGGRGPDGPPEGVPPGPDRGEGGGCCI